MLYLSGIASEYLLYQSGGALAIGLLLLGLVFAGAAIWQYFLGVRPPKEVAVRETVILSFLVLLLVIPLSLASGAYIHPLLVFSLSILLGLLPVGASLLQEQTK